MKRSPNTAGPDAPGRTTREPGNDAAEGEGEAEIDRILAESFPASDPPPWTPGIARVTTEPTNE